MSDLPHGWTSIRFDEVVAPDAAIIYGILQPGPEYPNGVKYVRPTEIQDGVIDLSSIRCTSPSIATRYARSRIAAGDVLLSIVGTIGKVALVPKELEGGNITQSSCRLRPDRALTSEHFVQSFLKAPQAIAQYDKKRMGTAVPRLNLVDVRNFEFPLPPQPEQWRILRKLDTLSARTTTVRTHLSAIDSLAERYKLAVLSRSVFRAGIQRRRLGELLSDIRYGTAAKCSYDPTGTPVLRIPNVQSGRIDRTDLKTAHLSEREAELLALQAGDVLVIRSNGSSDLVGRVAVVTEAEEDCLFAGYLIRMRFSKKETVPEYVRLCFQSDEVRAIIEAASKSTSGVKNVIPPS